MAEDKGLGLGIALGRRSIHVHSKEDIESSGSTSPNGPHYTGKARSTASFDSSRTERTGGLRGWLKGDNEREERERDMKEQLEEVEVEREMEREKEKEKREVQEMKAMKRVEEATPNLGSKVDIEAGTKEGVKVKRIALDQVARGRIVSLQVFRAIDTLAVLRDIGCVFIDDPMGDFG
jgi:hypothetical protein